MTAKRWDGDSWEDLTIFRRWNGSAWVDLTVAERWSGAWTDMELFVPDTFSATVAPSSASAFQENPSPAAPPAVTLFTNAVTVTAAGGTGSGPAYAWSRVSGSASISAASPTSATTTFSATVYSNSPVSAQFRCTVTRGVETRTVDVFVSLEYIKGIPQ